MKCPLCKKKDLKLIAKNKDMRFGCWGFRKKILECCFCSLQFLYPKWSEDGLKKIYKGYNKQKDFKTQKNPSKRISPYLTKYIDKNDWTLEVGCGSGDNVKRLRKKGYRVIGIDKDPSVTNHDKRIYHFDIFDSEMRRMKFSFVYAIHLLEHLAEPQKFIRRLNVILSDEGKFLLEIPNLEDPLLTLYKIEEFKKFYYVPHHVFFYNPRTIEFLLKVYWKTDHTRHYKIKRVQRYGLINHLRWIIFKRPGNVNFHIPILDNIYKWILVNIFDKSDTIIVTGNKSLL